MLLFSLVLLFKTLCDAKNRIPERQHYRSHAFVGTSFVIYCAENAVMDCGKSVSSPFGLQGLEHELRCGISLQ